MKIHSLFLFLLFFISQQLSAQLSDADFSKALAYEDLVILDEKMDVSFIGAKAYLITIIIEKEISYKINSEEGIRTFSPFILPQPIDEIYQPHSSRIRNANQLFDELKISHFTSEIEKPDGTTNEITPEYSTIEERIVTDENLFGFIYKYAYSFNGLEVNDVVKIKYRIEFPFRSNWYRLFSVRTFMNSKYPRKNYELNWSHRNDLKIDTSFINLKSPQIIINDNKNTYHWKFKNLAGCLDEQGAHPYLELPWLTFSPKPYDLVFEEYNSFENEFIPLWQMLTLYREDKLVSAVIDNESGIKDKDNLKLEKIADKYIRMAPDDTVGITRLRYFQRWVADSVKYDDAYSFFNNDENYMRDHPGMELYEGIVREQNKEFIYASILPKIGNSYFSAYPTDIRTGSISRDYFSPMYNNDFMFAAILNNNSFAYLIPKSDRNNYYCEELPYYYENIPVFLMHTYDFAGYKRNFNQSVRISLTPNSSARDNYRKTNSLVKINLTNNLISFTTKVYLSGQFSTLTRFVYNDNPVDSTINPIYIKPVWEIGEKQSALKYEMESSQFYFPFKANISASYNIEDLLKNIAEDKLKIDLNGWIKHITYKNFNDSIRYTNFYPDFRGHDTYVYMLDFGQAINILEKPDDIEIENDFGKYIFNIKQTSENQVLINSYFLIKLDMVDKMDILQVGEIYRAIENIDHSELIIAPKN